jgi:hypothetical protein
MIPPGEPSLRSPIINFLDLVLFLLSSHPLPPLRPSLAFPQPDPASTILMDRITALICLRAEASPLYADHKTVENQDTEEGAEDSDDRG